MIRSLITQKLIKLELVMKLYSRRNLSELGLYFGQSGVIFYVGENPGCTQIDIAKALSVSAASIALSTKRLEKAGLLIKEVDENNLRCKRVRLTELGTKLAEKAAKIRNEQDERMYGNLTEEEIACFHSVLDKITMNLTEEKENVVSLSIVRSLERQIEDYN